MSQHHNLAQLQFWPAMPPHPPHADYSSANVNIPYNDAGVTYGPCANIKADPDAFELPAPCAKYGHGDFKAEYKSYGINSKLHTEPAMKLPTSHSKPSFSKRERKLDRGIQRLMRQYRNVGLICADMSATQSKPLLARRRKLSIHMARLTFELQHYKMEYCIDKKKKKNNAKKISEGDYKNISEAPLNLCLRPPLKQ